MLKEQSAEREEQRVNSLSLMVIRGQFGKG